MPNIDTTLLNAILAYATEKMDIGDSRCLFDSSVRLIYKFRIKRFQKPLDSMKPKRLNYEYIVEYDRVNNSITSLSPSTALEPNITQSCDRPDIDYTHTICISCVDDPNKLVEFKYSMWA